MSTNFKLIAGMAVFALSMTFGGQVLANDEREIAAPDQPLELDRDAMVSELIQQWGGDEQFESTLRAANDANLLEAWDATSAGELEGVLALGDTTQDMVYTPVTPCRIVDTRESGAGGTFSATETRSYAVYGTTWVENQGGATGGCSSPVGEPTAVMLNITAVPQANGNLRAYANGTSTPNAAVMSYRNGVNLSNAVIVPTKYAPGLLCFISNPDPCKEIEIYASSATDVVIDVMGYFSAPQATTLDHQIQNSDYVTASVNARDSTFSPACPTGYVVTGGGVFAETVAGATNLRVTGSSPSNSTQWYCEVYNTSGTTTYDWRCESVCVRVPGI